MPTGPGLLLAAPGVATAAVTTDLVGRTIMGDHPKGDLKALCVDIVGMLICKMQGPCCVSSQQHKHHTPSFARAPCTLQHSLSKHPQLCAAAATLVLLLCIEAKLP